MVDMVATIGRPPVEVHFGENTYEAMRQAGIASNAAEAAELARDVALTAGPYYASQAAGEAATTTGQEFAVAPGDGTVIWYRRTGGGSTEIFRPILVGNSIFAAVAGETGILNYSYPVGDVRRYGVFPDGVTNWETAYASRITAIFANSIIDEITIYWPPGEYATSLNIGNTYNGSKMFFDHAVFFGILHWVSGISNVSWLGVMSTYDRFGITSGGCTGCRLGTVYCLSDPAKNVATPGAAGRGAHIVAAADFQFDLIDVVDCGAASASLPGSQGNLAAIWFECQGLSGLRGRLRVRQSQTNGVFIAGLDVDLDIIVEGYGAQAIDVGASSLEGLTTATTQQGAGIWFHRPTGRVRYKVSQSNASPGADTYSVVFSETGISTVATSRYKAFEVTYHDVTVGNGNRGVCIGSPDITATVSNVVFSGPVTTRLRTANTLASTYAGFNVIPPPATADNYRRLAVLGELEFTNFSAVQEFKATAVATAQARNYTELSIGGIRSDTGASMVVQLIGLAATGGILKGQIGYINIVKSQGGSAATTHLVDIDGTTGFVLGGGLLESSSAITMGGIRLANNVGGAFSIGSIKNLGTTGDLAALTIEANTGCKIGPCKMTRASIAQNAVVFVGTNTGCIFEGLSIISSFGEGFKNGTGMAFTNCTAIGCISTGNTDDTDLTTANFPAANQLGCTNFAI